MSYKQLISDLKSKTWLLLNQFKSVFTVDDESPMPETMKKSLPYIDPITVTTDGVAKLLRDLFRPKLPDEIPNQVLINCMEHIAPGLCRIFQKFHNNMASELEYDWHKANVTCVFKEGDKHQPGNYRYYISYMQTA